MVTGFIQEYCKFGYCKFTDLRDNVWSNRPI